MYPKLALTAANEEPDADRKQELERRARRGHSDDPARQILAAASRFYDVNRSAVLGPRRGGHQVALARKVAIYLIREDLGWPFSRCARFFRRQLHTIFVSYKSVADRVGRDPAFASELRAIRDLREHMVRRKDDRPAPAPVLELRLDAPAAGDDIVGAAIIPVVLPRVALVLAGDFHDADAVETYFESLPAGSTIVTMQDQVAHWATEFPLHVIHVMGRGEGMEDAPERQMLEHADCLVVFWGETGWGTHRAIELAEELGKKFVLLERAKS